jgi:5,10-methylenetetrahydromethanopterin reductase
MIEMGIQLIPTMPVNEVIKTIQAAEAVGYDYCVVADEGFMPDVYACLGLAARETSRIRLGPVTNGYTRHPAVTASAVATLNELSQGRALANLVAGGSMVLRPMGIPREAPLTVVRETIEVMRRLWSGEKVTWQGKRYRLDSAQISMGAQEIPIWLSVRGPKLLELAGREADGVVLMAKSDLGPAIEIVEQGQRDSGSPTRRIYLDRMAYTPEMLEEARALYTYAVMDSPVRMLKGLGLTDEEIVQIQEAVASGGPAAAARFITADMIKNYQIAGTPAECSQMLRGLIREHHLDVFLLNIISPGLEANTRLMEEIAEIVRGSEVSS